jgi:Nucleotidyl transferase AbiEii toxin, Type IV TA system
VSELLAAAQEVCEWLDEKAFRSCVIGGLAVQRWGEPRFTRDVDLTVMAEIGSEQAIADACLARFSARLDGARDFALRYRVVLVRASNGVDLDLALGASSFEIGSLARATPHEFARGCVLRTCSAEDLIVHKSVAGRPQDVADIRGIVNRQRARLDLPFVRRWLATFAELKDDPDLERPFEDALKAAAAAKRRST